MAKQSLTILRDKTILITGGTGSFGNTVARLLPSHGPRKIIIFSRDEKKQFDMRNVFTSPLFEFVIGDVRDKRSVDQVMDTVDYVFHAAALKQVPTCEFFPIEAVKTNILGAENVIQSAINHKVTKVVILSTDKAVYPINAMGMSKALMEKVMIAESRIAKVKNKSTQLCGVRYGNVLYSRGSVLPFFVEKIRAGKPLPVTNKHMTRFLLPLPKAVDLVLFALAHGKNGHMYIRKSPACTIETLAQAVASIFSYSKGIEEVGVRSGEKVHETLVSSEERLRAKDLGEFFEVPPESQGFDYDTYFLRSRDGHGGKPEAYTSENTVQLDVSQTVKLLLTLPEIREELRLIKGREA